MLFVENEPNKDPRVNLAIEEYLIRNVAPRDEILMFYINQPSIIIGRNQITVQEINVDYVEAHDIIVVRRLSGGGRFITTWAISIFLSSRPTRRITSTISRNLPNRWWTFCGIWACRQSFPGEMTFWWKAKRFPATPSTFPVHAWPATVPSCGTPI